MFLSLVSPPPPKKKPMFLFLMLDIINVQEVHYKLE